MGITKTGLGLIIIAAAFGGCKKDSNSDADAATSLADATVSANDLGQSAGDASTVADGSATTHDMAVATGDMAVAHTDMSVAHSDMSVAPVDMAIDMPPPLLGYGSRCGDDRECAAGHCTEGVCCDAACAGTCQSCLGSQTGGADGECANVSAGLDPDSECSDAECGSGVCNGYGNCGRRAAGYECRPAADDCDVPELCTGTTSTCPSDTVAAADTNACETVYTCDGLNKTCPTSCTTNAQCDDRYACLSGACVAARRVFVSSETHDGNFGGVAGADAFCQGLADAAGLVGDFRAWMSASTLNASARLSHASLPYYRVDGDAPRMFASNWADIIDGVTVAIATDENGVTRGNAPVWTGTFGDGTAAGSTCTDWTSSSSSVTGAAGYSSAGTTLWSYNTVPTCDTPLRVYCFEMSPPG